MRSDEPLKLASRATGIARRAWAIAALVAAGCSPTDVTLAEEPASPQARDAQVADAHDAEAERSQVPTYDSALAAPRGRVRVVGGQLLTDRGTLLRGATIGIDEAPDFPIDAQVFDDLKAAGLNAIHVYLENYSIPTGQYAVQAQRIVELAAAAQVYVVLSVGAGPARTPTMGGGTFDIEKIRSFWYYYGGLYADQTHVIFEVQNYPDPACKTAWPAASIAMEREAYQLLRRIAPSTHIVLMSYVSVPTVATLTAAVDALSVVDWSNASMATHGGSDCVAVAAQPAVIAAARARGVALLIGEVPRTSPGDDLMQYEKGHTGWMSMRWLVSSQDWTAFRSEYSVTGLTWCPDFGTWPQDSATCTAP